MNLKNYQPAKTIILSFQKNTTISKLLILLAATALLFLCSVCILTDAVPTDNESTIKITYPSNSSSVNIQETVTGTAENIQEGQKLWILVYPLKANKFYPQNGNVNVTNGAWSLTIGIGTSDNIGETFDIIAVLADQKAQEEFINYTNTGIKNDTWPGMMIIPDGAKEYARVRVTRIIPEIKITYPSNESFVDIQETATGIATNVPEGQKLWILVYPLAANKFYPQHESVSIISGEWSKTIGIGMKDNFGEKFEIIALLANQTAHEKLANYINTGNSTDWPGISNTPDGAKIYDYVNVTRFYPEVNITSPLNTAKLHDTITGTAKHIPEGQALWILIYPYTAAKYYPQSAVSTQTEDWALPVQFGQENSTGTKFDIIAILANQTAQDKLNIYYNESKANISWEGIPTLPEGAINLTRVTVTRIEDLPVDDGSSHSSSHSSGGGGGGGSPEPQSNVKAKEISQAFISNGKPVEFDFTRNVTPVVYVSFDSKKTFGKTSTITEMLKEKSTLVSEPPSDEVYKYVNIWVGNGGLASSKNIENPVIAFRVEKSWIQDKNIDQSSITLNNYNNSEKTWNQLQTNLSEEDDKDDKYLYFAANTLDFSFFSITGKKNASAPIANNSITNVSNIGGEINKSKDTSSEKAETKEDNSNIMYMICGFSLVAMIAIWKIYK
jgi:PGF-pre-PGF domain-containing protein